MAVVGIQPSIWVCKYHKYYKQNICSVHLKLIKVKNNFGDFSGNPQKLPWIPRKFGLSKSPKYVPKPRNCFPRPHPENRRFSGFFPRKNPKNLPSPVPTPSPKILKKFPRPHPVPELRGGGRGSPGIGVTIAHSSGHSGLTRPRGVQKLLKWNKRCFQKYFVRYASVTYLGPAGHPISVVPGSIGYFLVINGQGVVCL